MGKRFLFSITEQMWLPSPLSTHFIHEWRGQQLLTLFMSDNLDCIYLTFPSGVFYNRIELSCPQVPLTLFDQETLKTFTYVFVRGSREGFYRYISLVRFFTVLGGLFTKINTPIILSITSQHIINPTSSEANIPLSPTSMDSRAKRRPTFQALIHISQL